MLVEHFGTYSSEYRRRLAYLQGHRIERVAMEATGIYWITLYQQLEAAGIGVSRINPKETKQQKGKKTDVRERLDSEALCSRLAERALYPRRQAAGDPLPGRGAAGCY
ncbi:MAG: hypothetical protein M3342_16210 [Bacteroidota bacterium]|nr:hypothetical protein [Bacteroidota bacterium]